MGEKRGIALGEERMVGLMRALHKDGHDEAVFRAINDNAYRNELYKKYKL